MIIALNISTRDIVRVGVRIRVSHQTSDQYEKSVLVPDQPH